VFVLE
jgi:hypothetical protein